MTTFKEQRDAGKTLLITTTKKERAQIKAAMEKARRLKKLKI